MTTEGHREQESESVLGCHVRNGGDPKFLLLAHAKRTESRSWQAESQHLPVHARHKVQCERSRETSRTPLPGYCFHSWVWELELWLGQPWECCSTYGWHVGCIKVWPGWSWPQHRLVNTKNRVGVGFVELVGGDPNWAKAYTGICEDCKSSRLGRDRL